MPTALIVDDDPHLRAILARACAAVELRALCAPDGLEALDVLGEHPVDVILLDLSMPNLDGLGLLQRMREQPPEPLPAVIVVTAQNDAASKMSATRLGAIDFIEKPFRIANLQDRLRRVVAIVEIERRLARAETALESLRTLDPVTGVKASSELYHALEANFRRADREGVPLTCAVVSDEMYNAVLGAAGREAGDQRLKRLASLIAAQVDTERIFRVDAAELVILLPDVEPDQVKQWISELCSSVAADPDLQPARLAAACATFPHPEIAQPSTLYRAVNVSLAQARSQGRVTVFEGF